MARVQSIEDGRDRAASPEVMARLRVSLEQQVRRRPPALNERKLGRALRSLSAAACEPCAAPARAALARLRPEPGLRAAFLVQWGSRAKDGTAVKRLATWLALLRDYLTATGATEESLRPLAGDARTEAERNRSAYCRLTAVELLLGLLDHVVDAAGADRILPGGRLVVWTHSSCRPGLRPQARLDMQRGLGGVVSGELLRRQAELGGSRGRAARSRAYSY